MIRAKKNHTPAANLTHFLLSRYLNNLIPDTEGQGLNIRALLHQSAKNKPKGIKKIVLICVFLWVLDAVVWLLPLVGREPGQHIDDQGDQDKHQQSADVDLKLLRYRN